MICIYIYNIYVYRHIHHWKHQNIVGSGNFDYLLSHPFLLSGYCPSYLLANLTWPTYHRRIITTLSGQDEAPSDIKSACFAVLPRLALLWVNLRFVSLVKRDFRDFSRATHTKSLVAYAWFLSNPITPPFSGLMAEGSHHDFLGRLDAVQCRSVAPFGPATNVAYCGAVNIYIYIHICFLFVM